MCTIYMELGDRYIKMETVDSLKEAVWRCSLYYNRNPKPYHIEYNGTYYLWTDLRKKD